MIYFNENDAFPAQWLTKLYPSATVDDRSICEIESTDVAEFRRAHFFGGIGGWEYALRLAGWPAGRSVWTGSCPCQPFSCAGKGEGEADKRHLWPEFRRLIAECRPAIVFGEQVASKLGRQWFSGVRADLEALGYAVGAAGLPAASVGSPHPRSRIFWVADSGAAKRGWGREPRREHGREIHAANGCGIGRLADAASVPGTEQRREPGSGIRREAATQDAAECCRSGGLADPENGRCEDGSRDGRDSSVAGSGGPDISGCGGAREMGDSASGGLGIDGRPSRDSGHADEPGAADGLGHAIGTGPQGFRGHDDVGDQSGRIGADQAGSIATTGAAGYWDAYDLVYCRDGKVRRIEPGTFPLADGVPNRVGRLRGYGNAICPQVAARFITAILQVLES